MVSVSPDELAAADIFLSIVPPGEAEALAHRLAPILRRAPKKPVYVDCNAVSPRTVGAIASIVEATGTPFVDAGIIGGPPKTGGASPVFYPSREKAGEVAALHEVGLDCKVLDGPLRATPALQICYAGMTHELTAPA